MSRNVKFVVVALAVVGVVIALLTSLAQGSQSSALDTGLKRTADRMQMSLKQPDSHYSAEGSFLNAFNLYQHDLQTVLQSTVPGISKGGQFAQVIVYETKTMPPVWRQLQYPGKPQIVVDGNLISQVAAGKTVFTTVHQQNLAFRVYLTPIDVPVTMRNGGTQAVLQVFHAEQT